MFLRTQSGRTLCAALLVSAFDEFVLWVIPTDLIKFARQLGIYMKEPWGCRANVREAMKLLDVI